MYFDVIQASLGASRRTPGLMCTTPLPPQENSMDFTLAFTAWSQARAVWVLFMILRGER